uniref:CRACD like n=1 Tax=Mandrillus leucophaeus TaxID=9568 RepID=A0A2K5XCV6_MANLE
MISTRVMDIKLRETAEGLGEDSTGKKKSKFKTFKKFFGKKKRKESPSSTESSTWKQSQTRNEVIAIESGPVGYDSEDELEESRGTLGSRALSHDSIFIPESGQDPTRPVRVFSQENVCDRIKALQLKIQCNVKMGPPPPPGGLPAKRGEDAGMSSEDDGLPRSPPEMSLLHDVGPGTTIKVSVVSPDHVSDSTVSARTSDSSLAPVADFSYPPESSSCLDNSAAKHKLQVKPRNQRSSKMRRLSSRAQSESLSDLTCTPEEEENEEKPLLEVSPEESPSSGQQDVPPDRGPEPGPPAPLPPLGGVRPPLPRKPLLQSFTLPHQAAPPDTGPGERDPRKEPRTAEKRSLRRGAEKGLPPAATGPGADGQPVPPWITVTRQKRRGTLDQPPNQEDKPGTRTLKSEPGKQAKVPEREPVKQADFVRSKSFLITPVKPAVDRKQGAKLNLKEGLQRGISLSHQNLAQSAVMMEKELHQLKRASYASTDQPSWMELARKKSQAWSDMPQIIK